MLTIILFGLRFYVPVNSYGRDGQFTGLSHPFWGMGPMELGKLAAF